MSVSIGNCKKEIDIGYMHFFKLRTKIAFLLDAEFWMEYSNTPPTIVNENLDIIIENYMKRENHIPEDVVNDILDFLYQPDCGGKLSYKACRNLYNLIKDYNDDVIYGFENKPNPAKFSDFKEIVYDCWKNRRQLRWY